MNTPMSLFLLGIVEMIIISAATKVVSDNKVISSGVITVINIFIWYYVLQSVVTEINNLWIVTVYALGCAIGTMITVSYFRHERKIKRRFARVVLTLSAKNPVRLWLESK